MEEAFRALSVGDYDNIEWVVKGFLTGELSHNYVYSVLAWWMAEQGRTPQEILRFIDPIFKSIPGAENGILSQSLVGLVTLEHVASKAPMITPGPWEDILFCVVKYLENFHHDRYSFWYLTSNSKKWIGDMLSCPSKCPNHYLQLEMIRMISIFGFDYDIETWGNITNGIVTLMCDPNIEYNHIVLGLDILCSAKDLKYVFQKIHLHGQLLDIGDKVKKQLHRNCQDKEVHFVSNIISLLGKFARLAKEKSDVNLERYTSAYSAYIGTDYVYKCIDFFWKGLCLLFKEGMTDLRSVCRHPLMVQTSSQSIRDITDALLAINDHIFDVTESPFRIQSLMRPLCGAMQLRDRLVDILALPSVEYQLPVVLLQREHLGHSSFGSQFHKEFKTTRMERIPQRIYHGNEAVSGYENLNYHIMNDDSDYSDNEN